MPLKSTPSGSGIFLFFFAKKLRLSNPWNYKVPLLITIPYLVMLGSDRSGYSALIAVFLSLAIIIGVAGFGYLSNDLGDRRQDALIGKENASAGLSLSKVISLYALFLALALLPWLRMPINLYTALLLAFQFVLFALYSFPPFRLKERGLAGVVTDALYAHVNPALLAASTFYFLCGSNFPEFGFWLFILALWQLVLGIRNILFHQLKDFEDDIRSGTNTFVTNYGLQKTERLVALYIIPLEAALFVAFMGANRAQLYLLAPFIFLYWMAIFVRNRKQLRGLGFRERAYLLFDDLYVLWLPVFVVALLPLVEPLYAVVIGLHLLVFRSGPKRFVLNLLKK